MSGEDRQTRQLGTLVRLVTTKASSDHFKVGLEHIESWTGRLVESDAEFEGEGVAFQAGDVLFGKLRPYLAKVWIADKQGAAVGDFLVLRPHVDVSPRFAAYLILRPQFIDLVSAAVYGSKMPRVSWDILKAMLVPTATPQRQELIADYLDRETAEIDAFIADQEELIALLGERRLSVLDTRLGQASSGAVIRPLKSVAEIQAGLTLGKDWQGEVLSVFPYLRVANVQAGRVDLSELKEILLPKSVARRHLLKRGDVLVTEGGDLDKLGRGAVWNGQVPTCLHQNHVFAVRCRPSVLSPDYLALILESSQGRQYFTTTGKQSTNLASTNSTILKNFNFAVPEKGCQDQVGEIVASELSNLDVAIVDAREAIALSKERRAALITAAVTGQIDVMEKKGVPV